MEDEGTWGTPPPPPTGEEPEGEEPAPVAAGVTVSYQVVHEVWGITEGVTAGGAGTMLVALETTGAGAELDQLEAGAELVGMG